MDAARVTMESHLAELARAREFAIAHGVGLYEDRLRFAVGPTDIELIKAIEDTLGKELADEIATALGGVSETV